MSPKVMDDGTYFYGFSSRDVDHHPHDPHVHVRKRNNTQAKFGLSPVVFRYSDGIPPHELTAIKKRVEKHETFFLEKWQEFFGDF